MPVSVIGLLPCRDAISNLEEGAKFFRLARAKHAPIVQQEFLLFS